MRMRPDVGLDGRLADDQAFRDLGVGQATGDQGEHLALAAGQDVQRLGRRGLGIGPVGELLQEPPRHSRREQRAASCDDPHGPAQLLGRGVLQQEPLAHACRAA
jgi:hypothetical protein